MSPVNLDESLYGSRGVFVPWSYLSFVYISLLHHVVGILYDIYACPSSTFSIFAEGLPVAAIVLPTSA